MNIPGNTYENSIKKLWKIDFDVKKFFPAEISNWIKYQSTILGVSDLYICWPLLVTTAYFSQHTFVRTSNSIHIEPLIIYGLVGG